MDNLGMATRKKYDASKENNYLALALKQMKVKLMAELEELEQKLTDLYPSR